MSEDIIEKIAKEHEEWTSSEEGKRFRSKFCQPSGFSEPAQKIITEHRKQRPDDMCETQHIFEDMNVIVHALKKGCDSTG